VIQIDSPPTVSSFLQRMGRTGRRAGMTRNCLFLATRDETLVQAAGLIDLWASGYIEPVIPPPDPYHILAQQLMALALQENGIGRREWLDWIRNVPAFADMPAERIDQVVGWMLEKEVLWEDQGILWLGRKGEAAYGRRHFLELFSVFTSPPLFSVRYGSQELGSVDELTFLGEQDEPRILLLGGRFWRVNHIDWQRRVAYVEATEVKGRSRWKGEGQDLGFRLCQAIRNVLGADDNREWWSHRARQQISEVRQEFAWLDDDGTAVVRSESGEAVWWTFAGVKANATLACQLSRTVKNRVTYDSFTVTFEPHLSFDVIGQALDELRARDARKMRPAVEEQAIDGLKFSECLPHNLAVHILEARLCDPAAVKDAVHQPTRFIVS
jgi:ATP-dependent helicase Lhr and Lhr-like helicase